MRGESARNWDEDCNRKKMSPQHRKDHQRAVQRFFPVSWKRKVLALVASGPVTWLRLMPSPLDRISVSVVYYWSPYWFTKPLSWYKRVSCYFQGVCQQRSMWRWNAVEKTRKNNCSRQKRNKHYVQQSCFMNQLSYKIVTWTVCFWKTFS